MNIFVLVRESNVDGEIIFNVTPCEDKAVARSLMDNEIAMLLKVHHKFKGLNLDDIERVISNGGECDFMLERSETSFFICCNHDDYYDKFDITMKSVVTHDDIVSQRECKRNHCV